MLTCIKCSNQKEDESEEGPRGTSSTKEPVKSLTKQLKDIALKVASSSQSSKPGTSSSCRRASHRPSPDFDSMSEIVPFPGSSSSAPASYFTNSRHPPSRFAGGFSGDRTPGGQSISAAEIVVEDDNNEPNEWISQIEPAIDITFIALPEGGNDLKRIRFSRDIFDRCKAQRWWRDNFDRIMELYNVQRVNRQALDTLAISDNGRDSSYLRLESSVGSPRMAPSATIEYGRNFYDPSGTRGHNPPDLQEQDGGRHFNAGSSAYGIGGTKGGMSSWDVSRTTTSSQDDASISVSNANEIESEWIVEEEEGVYITIRQLTDGTRELKRVRFSREKFGEVDARLWFEANQDRIQAQYL